MSLARACACRGSSPPAPRNRSEQLGVLSAVQFGSIALARLQLGEQVSLPQLDAGSPVGGFMLVPEPPDVPCQVQSATSLIGRGAGRSDR